MLPEIYANKPAGTIFTALFGPQPELRYIRSNTLIGHTTGRQRVHKDIRFRYLNHPFAVTFNVILCDCTPENGSTEIWLGTHNSSSWEDHEGPENSWVRQEVLDERRKVRPPVYPSIKKGSIVLRDVRVW